MRSLARCIGIAPAERCTESDHRPSGKLVRIPTAPTAITSGEKKPYKTPHFQAVTPRAVLTVAVGKAAVAGDGCHQHRSQNILHIAVLPAVRAVRSVSFRIL